MHGDQEREPEDDNGAAQRGAREIWQLVFLHSKVIGAAYDEDQLPRRSWNGPKDTYLQRRLRRAKRYLAPDKGQ